MGFNAAKDNIEKSIRQIGYEGDLSDIGNEIGTAIRIHISDKPGFSLHDFITGVKHGVKGDGDEYLCIMVMDYENGKLFKYHVHIENSTEVIEDFISEKGHSLNDCYYMVKNDDIEVVNK